jgi:hypothetical protein
VLSFSELEDLTRGKVVAEVACPLCGPSRRAAVNRTRKVLKIWDSGDDFISYNCARCGAKGYAKPEGYARSTPRPKPQPAQVVPTPDKSDTARYLWAQRKPVAGTIAETYLRDCRGYHGPLPPTLGFLPARGEHPPAMIAAFGIPSEPEPGRLVVNTDAIAGVHLTKLKSEGSGKADVKPDKIMIGPSMGQPIVLRPANDLGGLLIAEGIENALACHASGLGLWAAGSASRLPAIADAIPDYVEAVTIVADTDDSGAGVKFSKQLGQLLLRRNIDVLIEMGASRG